MKHLADLLGKFKKLIQEGEEIQNHILVVLENNNIRIKDSKNIKIRNGIVTLKITPIQKSEIALKQKKIIEELAKDPQTKHITVVR